VRAWSIPSAGGHLPFRTVVHRAGRATSRLTAQHTGPGSTGYVSNDVELTGRDAAVGGPWLDVELPPGTEVMLTLRLRLRVRVPAARTPWDRAPWDAAEEG
jgi:hypothetical protein